MNRDKLLVDKLDQLAELTLRGETPTPIDLCRDAPDLLSELEHQLRAFWAIDRLRLPADAESPGLMTESFVAPGPGTRMLGRFRLETLLGAGGMGEVWRAFDAQLERAVAVKLLHADLAKDATAKARFLREARAAARIEHDHVVRIFDVSEIGGSLVLTMPLLKGENLEARLKRAGALSPAETARIGGELLSGLAAAHRAGIIHRDVKPSNIWLEAPHGRALLLDFGLARPEIGDGLSQAGGIYGTPGYMSPEQARGEPLDARSDLFSVGAVLYCAVTGKQPFAVSGLNTLAQLERIKSHDPLPPHQVLPAVPPELSNFIMTLLQKDPNGRPMSAEEAAQALRRIQGLPAVSPSTSAACAEQPTGSMAQGPTAVMSGAPVKAATPPRWRLVAVAGIGLIAVVTALVSLRSVLQREQTRSAPPAPASAFQGSLDVLVARGKAQERYSLNTPGLLPLQPGVDFLRIEVSMEQAAYVYVVWIDTEGVASLLYPWDETLKRRPADEAPVAKLFLPSDSQVAPVTGGPAGTESLLLLARPEKLPVDFDLMAMFTGLGDQRSKFAQEAAWFENGQLVTNDRLRSSIGFDLVRGRPDAKKAVEIDDPVIRLQVRLRSDEMRQLFPYTRGVCFSNAGDRR